MLYEHLGLGTLPTENVLIASALWGFVRPTDRIPAYRFSMSATLPRIASLPALWRAPLRKGVPDEGLIVDLRSGAYTAAWKPRARRSSACARSLTARPSATWSRPRAATSPASCSAGPGRDARGGRVAGPAGRTTAELPGAGRQWNVDVRATSGPSSHASTCHTRGEV